MLNTPNHFREKKNKHRPLNRIKHQHKKRSWDSLNRLKQERIRKHQAELYKLVGHVFDLEGAYKMYFKKNEAIGLVDLEYNDNYVAIEYLQDVFRKFSQQGMINGALNYAFKKFNLIQIDTEQDLQKNTYACQVNCAPYAIAMPGHVAACLVIGNYFYKINRGNRADDAPLAGIEIYKIPQGKRAAMIRRLNQLATTKEVSYKAFEEIPNQFRCQYQTTIETQEQSVSNCTITSNKLLILGLIYGYYRQHHHGHRAALQKAREDYNEFVDNLRDYTLDYYLEQVSHPNRKLVKKLKEAHRAQEQGLICRTIVPGFNLQRDLHRQLREGKKREHIRRNRHKR